MDRYMAQKVSLKWRHGMGKETAISTQLIDEVSSPQDCGVQSMWKVSFRNIIACEKLSCIDVDIFMCVALPQVVFTRAGGKGGLTHFTPRGKHA
jgi:hypothetical protein